MFSNRVQSKRWDINTWSFLLLTWKIISAFWQQSYLAKKTSEKLLAGRESRVSQLREEMESCHPRWPEEKYFIEMKIRSLKGSVNEYYRSFWTYLEWLTAGCIIASTILTFLNFYTGRNRFILARRVILSLGVGLTFVQLMSACRAFSVTGKFVAILGNYCYLANCLRCA